MHPMFWLQNGSLDPAESSVHLSWNSNARYGIRFGYETQPRKVYCLEINGRHTAWSSRTKQVVIDVAVFVFPRMR